MRKTDALNTVADSPATKKTGLCLKPIFLKLYYASRLPERLRRSPAPAMHISIRPMQ